jgi:hypothetical protein
MRSSCAADRGSFIGFESRRRVEGIVSLFSLVPFGFLEREIRCSVTRVVHLDVVYDGAVDALAHTQDR